MVIFDSNFLLYLISEPQNPPTDPITQELVLNAENRIWNLLDLLEAQKVTVGIPTPVLGEIGAHVEESAEQKFHQRLLTSNRFEVLDFDRMAAQECAHLYREGFLKGNKRFDSDSTANWQRLKVDRQIFAIAKTRKASCVYTSDGGLYKLCQFHKIDVRRLVELPDTGRAEQLTMLLPSPDEN